MARQRQMGTAEETGKKGRLKAGNSVCRQLQKGGDGQLPWRKSKMGDRRGEEKNKSLWIYRD